MTRADLQTLIETATEVFTFTPNTLRGVMVNVKGEEALFDTEPAAGYALLYLAQPVGDAHHTLAPPTSGQPAHSR